MCTLLKLHIYLNIFFYYISISVHSTLFNLWVFSFIGVILHPYCVIPMYVCTIMHVCIVNKKWSDKDTDLLFIVS